MTREDSTNSGSQVSRRVVVGSRLEHAAKHVGDHWLPVNPELLKKMQQQLEPGMVNVDLRALVKEIQGDFSLFFYCLRELTRMVREEGGTELPTVESPMELLEWAGVERLRAILDVDPDEVSNHRFKDITGAQSTRFQEMMISATTSESLAGAYALDPDLAFTSALLRQLGYALVAWNYPTIYERAIGEVAQGKSIDSTLTQMLGFSPTLLAIRIVRKWNLPECMVGALSDSSLSGEGGWHEDDEVHAVTRTLVKICKTGEALARANNPKQYPSASNDWEFARTEIEKALGAAGVALIQSKVRETCLKYTELLPDVFTPAFILDPEAAITDFRKETMLERNPYVNQCREFLKEKLTDLYSKIRPMEVSRDSITAIAKEIMPLAGYTHGCVFTIDPGSQHLVPQLSVGRSMTRDYPTCPYSPAFSPYPRVEKKAVTLTDFILEGFKAIEPIVRLRGEGQDSHRVLVVAPLGFSQRVGVVTLEIATAMFLGDEAQQLTHFKAMVQALNDCLGLK